MVSPNPALPTTQEPQAGLLAVPPWQHETAVPLLPHVRRLTAPNPGLMTGPGTNSYLVGEAATGWLVIDPGPDEPAHVERLWDAAGGDIRLIVCTHSHADHAPAARPLQALCARRGGHTPPLLGLPSAPTANQASHFVPDRPLADGERLLLQTGDGAVRHTLQVIHTPGHAANHLCLLLPGDGNGDGLLFSGDHILNGSTTVINPPDGNMTAYLEALDALDAACTALGLSYILPAHGHVMNDAQAVIARLKAHRLAREAKVRVAMQARPHGTLDDWVELAYDDVPQSIWPLAKRSLLAHVERLQALPGGAP